MINFAKEILETDIYLELSVHNTDKGFLDFIELEDRINGLEGYEFILTNAPTMKAKIEAIKKYAPMAEVVLIVGADTWDRIWDIKYGFSTEFLQNFFAENKVKFLVLNRGGYTQKQFEFGKDFLVQHDKIKDFITPNISSSEIRKSLTKE